MRFQYFQRVKAPDLIARQLVNPVNLIAFPSAVDVGRFGEPEGNHRKGDKCKIDMPVVRNHLRVLVDVFCRLSEIVFGIGINHRASSVALDEFERGSRGGGILRGIGSGRVVGIFGRRGTPVVRRPVRIYLRVGGRFLHGGVKVIHILGIVQGEGVPDMIRNRYHPFSAGYAVGKKILKQRGIFSAEKAPGREFRRVLKHSVFLNRNPFSMGRKKQDKSSQNGKNQKPPHCQRKTGAGLFHNGTRSFQR